MLKELLLAITLGSLLGFGVTGGYLVLKKDKSSVRPPVTTTIPTKATERSTSTLIATSTPESASTIDHHITVESPENESIISTSQISVKGTTTPLSTIIINTSIKSYYTTADNSGNFSQDIEIDSGPNSIQIDSFDPLDNQASTKLIVTYSTAKI
jgi:hypothetical protein